MQSSDQVRASRDSSRRDLFRYLTAEESADYIAIMELFSATLLTDLSAAEPAPMPRAKPTEAPFERDYPAPGFQPSWKKPQINHLLVQDFVIFAHMDVGMVSKLLDKEPGLLNATMEWGGGDWESALGAASHMGRRDIAEVLLDRGARIDIFCAAMLGLVDVVKAFLTLQPKLIDAKARQDGTCTKGRSET